MLDSYEIYYRKTIHHWSFIVKHSKEVAYKPLVISDIRKMSPQGRGHSAHCKSTQVTVNPRTLTKVVHLTYFFT